MQQTIAPVAVRAESANRESRTRLVQNLRSAGIQSGRCAFLVCIYRSNRNDLVKISVRLNFTSYLVATFFLLAFVLSLEAAPEQSSPAPAQASGTQIAKPKADSVHRTEPEEPEISEREKRELEIRAQQTIGKVIAAPDGSLFLYEWRRPYDWDKDFGTYPKSVADHLQSWIYRVDPEISQTDSRYLFLYESGASMWLVCFLTTEVAVVERYHRDPYPVWNFRGARERGRVHPYLRLDNLSNTGYEEIEGVRMPARSIALGLELEIRKGTRRLHLQR
jgi:hypothetical protein